MGIGKRIKEARESMGLTQNELADLIGVTGSAITNYEKETSHPKESVMYKLLQVLNVDANYLFQDVVNVPSKQNDVSLSEYKLIEKYRALDAKGKSHVDSFIEWESDRVRGIDTLQEPSAIYTYMRKIACAGTGFYFDDIPTETIKAPYMEGADFIIGVNGDSMEPDYYDGDLLYVKKTEMINYGDVGIFTINNECFLKEFGRNGLISRNKKYKDIPANEDVRLIGKIIGKVPE